MLDMKNHACTNFGEQVRSVARDAQGVLSQAVPSASALKAILARLHDLRNALSHRPQTQLYRWLANLAALVEQHLRQAEPCHELPLEDEPSGLFDINLGIPVNPIH